MTAEEQRQADLNEVKIRRIENGFLVRLGGKWYGYPDIEAAFRAINGHFTPAKATS